MLSIVPLLLALVTMSPAPSPSSTPVSPLRIIVTVHASALCSAFADHANGAITSVTNNDKTLLGVVHSLGTSHMGRTPITFNNELQLLGQLAVSINQESSNGQREIGQIRSLAKTSTNPVEQQELTASADALGGALWRQQKIARDLNGFIAFMTTDQTLSTNTGGERAASDEVYGTGNGHDEAPYGEPANMHGPYGIPGVTSPTNDPFPFPGSSFNPTPTQQATNAAMDFQRRLAPIGLDELHAAVHIEQASEGC